MANSSKWNQAGDPPSQTLQTLEIKCPPAYEFSSSLIILGSVYKIVVGGVQKSPEVTITRKCITELI